MAINTEYNEHIDNEKLLDRYFYVQTVDEALSFLAEHLPTGRAFDKKYDNESNLNKFLKGAIVPGIREIQKLYRYFASEFNVYTTRDRMPEWERSVGIPDNCIPLGATLEERRAEVIARLSKVPLVTLDDLQKLARGYLRLLNRAFICRFVYHARQLRRLIEKRYQIIRYRYFHFVSS